MSARGQQPHSLLELTRLKGDLYNGLFHKYIRTNEHIMRRISDYFFRGLKNPEIAPSLFKQIYKVDDFSDAKIWYLMATIRSAELYERTKDLDKDDIIGRFCKDHEVHGNKKIIDCKTWIKTNARFGHRTCQAYIFMKDCLKDKDLQTHRTMNIPIAGLEKKPCDIDFPYMLTETVVYDSKKRKFGEMQGEDFYESQRTIAFSRRKRRKLNGEKVVENSLENKNNANSILNQSKNLASSMDKFYKGFMSKGLNDHISNFVPEGMTAHSLGIQNLSLMSPLYTGYGIMQRNSFLMASQFKNINKISELKFKEASKDYNKVKRSFEEKHKDFNEGKRCFECNKHTYFNDFARHYCECSEDCQEEYCNECLNGILSKEYPICVKCKKPFKYVKFCLEQTFL